MGVPAQRVLRYHLNHTGVSEDTHYIDLAKDLSRINRRLYRQGKCYGVLGASIHDATSDCFLKICTAPNTWSVRNAWKKGFALWKKMRKEALQGAGVRSNVTATWADFKVYLTNDMTTNADQGIPIDCDQNQVGSGEWHYSTYVSPEGTASYDEFVIWLLGPNSGGTGTRAGVGLVEGYQNSRARVQSDDPSVDPAEFELSWMTNLFDDGETVEEILEDIIDHGDAPPYDHNDMVGSAGNMVQPHVAGLTHVSLSAPMGYIGPFIAPCGLLQVDTRSGTDGNIIDLVIELAPGNYKGVDAVAV